MSRDGIFRTVFLLYQPWMDAEGVDNLAKSLDEFAAGKVIQ
jgi:hypothetical protein